MSNAPEGFIPWYFPVKKNGKDPDGLAIAKKAPEGFTGKKGSWKELHARLTYAEAIQRLKQRDNVGIASRDSQLLVIYDKDKSSVKDKVYTLTTLSRKRIAGHSFCWRNKTDESLNTNIPTEDGEVRSCDQYVLAPGSFVSVNEKEKETIDTKLGLYTVRNDVSPATITFIQLPDIFLKQFKKNMKNQERIAALPKKTIKVTGKHSTLFDLEIEHVIGNYKSSARFGHPLHASDTSANFSVGNGVAHCWRHLVSLNPIQFLCVKSGYLSCEDAGTGHKNNPSSSAVVGDDGAIFHSWKQAKEDGLIPGDDAIPIRAMQYVARKHKLVKENYKFQGKFPIKIYYQILKIIEEEY